jgi:hypothetical protein
MHIERRGILPLLRRGRAESQPQTDKTPERFPAAEALLDREIPVEAINKQVGLYTHESAQVADVRRFDPLSAIRRLNMLRGRTVIAIDAGGKKIAVETLRVIEDGRLIKMNEPILHRSQHGEGYMEIIDGVVDDTNSGSGYAIGFSIAGRMNGTRPDTLTNLLTLQDGLAKEPYNGDFANGFSNAISVDGDNDGVAGAVASTVEAARSNPNIKKVLFYINGGGVGGSAWDEGVLKRTEIGHVQVIDDLNPLNKNLPCNQKGSPTPDLTCVENMSASGAGIEELHYQITGETKIVAGIEVPLEGEDIERKFLAKNELATTLIDNAAILAAAEILGLDKATHTQGTKYKGFDAESTAIVCHGGFFRYKGVRERVEQILTKMTESEVTVLYSDDFTKETTGNACADGAAILALNAVGK